MDLAEICQMEYPWWVSKMLLVQVQIAIVGADIQEVLGSAVALKILFGLELYIGCLITACTTFSFLFILRYGVRAMEVIHELYLPYWPLTSQPFPYALLSIA